MNRAERRKQGHVENQKGTLIFHSRDEAVQYVLRGPGQEAMNQEIRRQILEQQDRVELDMDAAVLWALYISCGFGPKRLKKFYHDFIRIWKDMRKQYEDEDSYAERIKLKKLGVDVEKLREEVDKNDLLQP